MASGHVSPKSYVEQYHNLTFRHPLTGVPLKAAVTSYGSGWGPEPGCTRPKAGPLCQIEYLSGLLPALNVIHHGKANIKVPSPFWFDKQPLPYVDSAEDFTLPRLVRAYVGKGTPGEITDALRLALACGRIGIGKDAAGHAPAKPTLDEYVKAFMTIDCNALVGNYLDKHPSDPIAGFAVARRRRESARDIVEGDPIVTVNAAGRYAHIALVEGCEIVSETAAGAKVRLQICEWGEAGTIEKHAKTVPGGGDGVVELRKGPKTEYGLGFDGRNSAFRYIFGPPEHGEPRQWAMHGAWTG